MSRLIQTLLSGGRPDLKADLGGQDIPALSRLAEYRYAGQPMLDHVRSLLGRLLDDPPPIVRAGSPVMRPWWEPVPAVYLAAALEHVGLPEVAGANQGLAPHARESASSARELLREEGCPFYVREHAVALIVSRRKPASMIGSGALGETYMQFACSLDLRSLYRLARQEARVAGDTEGEARLEAFRDQVEMLGVFGGPPAPPLGEDVVAGLGYTEQSERHRALNALRYFRLVARMQEPDWFRERLRQERERPSSRLNILVGPAGCGKSSWALERLDHTIMVSSDRMRRELTGDPSDQSQNYLVFQRCMDRVRAELGRGREVTFDATNYSEELRSMPVQAGRWSGARIVSYFFDVSLAESLRRNRDRSRMVPEEVIRRHYRLLEPPALYEADRHMFVDPAGAVHQYWPAPGGTGDSTDTGREG
ncbi:MAG: AAA family ATPase [Candidatus Brocadiaceae bacterium]|jgi:predicted kinase